MRTKPIFLAAAALLAIWLVSGCALLKKAARQDAYEDVGEELAKEAPR